MGLARPPGSFEAKRMCTCVGLQQQLAAIRIGGATQAASHPGHWRCCRASFRGLLAAGSRDAGHPLLRWLLAQAPLLSTRAYVGHHLTMPEVRYPGR